MLSLRQKLSLGFVRLLATILTIGAQSVVPTNNLQRSKEGSVNGYRIVGNSNVSLGHWNDGINVSVHESLRENIGDEVISHDDLCSCGCSRFLVRLPGACPCTTGMVLSKGGSG